MNYFYTMVNRKDRLLGVFLVFTFLLLLPCCSNKLESKDDFVYLNGKDFEIKGKKFFPVLMNYLADLREINGELVLGPTKEYDTPGKFQCEDVSCIEERLESHFKTIKSMGFNTIRLCGFSVPMKKSKYFVFPLYKGSKAEQFELSEESIPLFLDALNKLVSIAKKSGLKIMMLLPKPIENLDQNTIRKNYIINTLKYFKSNNTIFSYDFFNEPLYFDNEEKKIKDRSKEEAFDLVSKWKSWMEKYAPNQLLTVSLAEIIEVFEWDASILPLDFVSFHAYHPLRVPNAIYWFSKYIDKPCMITETSLPSDNDSIDYKLQSIFMEETLQRTIDCGISGYGWWQFQDVKWGPFAQNGAGLIRGSKIKSDYKGNAVYGEVKPAAEVAANFIYEKKYECDCFPNYSNVLGYYNYRINGRVVDKITKEPIEGAVIRGWNKKWTRGQNTFTDSTGAFSLYSNDKVIHFKVSAPGKKLVFFHKKMDYLEENNSIFSADNTGLHYKDIHFQPFIKKSSIGTSVLDFDPQLFNNFAFEAELGKVELEEVDFIVDN